MKALLSLFSLVAVSCSSNILVVDESGSPVPDATVIPLSSGFSWPDSKATPFHPLRSGPRAASEPSRKKQIPER